MSRARLRAGKDGIFDCDNTAGTLGLHVSAQFETVTYVQVYIFGYP
jgi:hypothetical protein